MHTSYLNIQKAKVYSDEKIKELRDVLQTLDLDKGIAIVAVGSIARREASEQSDLDYFVITTSEVDNKSIRTHVSSVLSSAGIREPSSTGAFAKAVARDEFLSSIGGNEESNDELTRRMLFLLESEWLYGEEIYEELISAMIDCYIKDSITPHQLARFFLNDLIRYYRTICVDFEYKTGTLGKSWGDRNIKIMFSRKLLYFSGVISSAETTQSAFSHKREILGKLFRLTPMERIEEVCGVNAEKALKQYDEFLGWLSDVETREFLAGVSKEAQCDRFREMKNAGHHFSWELELLLRNTYAGTHPIHQALVL